MRLSYKIYKNINQIKDQWIQIQSEKTSPFLSYSYMKIAMSCMWYIFLINKIKPKFFVFYEDFGKVVAVVPLLKLKDGGYELFIHLNGFDYSDILASDKQTAGKCLSILKRNGYLFDSYWVREDSLAFDWLKLNIPQQIQISNVEIPFYSHKSWFDGLSKSIRQNIRTAYNRMVRDNHNYFLQVFNGGDKQAIMYKNGRYLNGEFGLSRKCLFDQIMSLYFCRHNERYSVKTNVIKRWLLRYYHFATSNYEKNPQCLTMALYIDGALAAFTSGVLSLDKKSYMIPRLSINNDYSFYSPGNILISESIKYLCEHSNIRLYDLDYGDEKYKFDLGGKIHYSYHFLR